MLKVLLVVEINLLLFSVIIVGYIIGKVSKSILIVFMNIFKIV